MQTTSCGVDAGAKRSSLSREPRAALFFVAGLLTEISLSREAARQATVRGLPRGITCSGRPNLRARGFWWAMRNYELTGATPERDLVNLGVCGKEHTDDW